MVNASPGSAKNLHPEQPAFFNIRNICNILVFGSFYLDMTDNYPYYLRNYLIK